MKNLKTISILLLFFLFTTCEDTGDLYFPKVECRSDWLTNQYYHLPVVSPDVSNLQAGFTASIDGESWKAEKVTACLYENGKRYINAYNDNYHFNIFFTGEEINDVVFWIKKFQADETEVLEKKITHFDLNASTGVINLDFSVKVVFHYHYSNPVHHDTVEITNGRISNLRFHNFYERTEYTLSTADSILDGEWKLIEIADCLTGKVYYPPYYYPIWMEFDTAEFQYEPTPGYLRYDYPAYIYGRNTHSLSYKFLNDTTIITSSGGGTQAGMAKEDADFYYLVCHLVDLNTMTIRLNKNLLELKTGEGVYLRFFK